jgi:hypothetical protein
LDKTKKRVAFTTEYDVMTIQDYFMIEDVETPTMTIYRACRANRIILFADIFSLLFFCFIQRTHTFFIKEIEGGEERKGESRREKFISLTGLANIISTLEPRHG